MICLPKRYLCGQVLDMLPESGHGYLELVLFLESTGRRRFIRWNSEMTWIDILVDITMEVAP